jgi:hypothetical protein
MALVYKIPQPIHKLIQDSVSNINLNLADVKGNAVNKPSFLHGTWPHLMSELAKYNQSNKVAGSKYPAFLLVHDLELNFSTDEESPSSDLMLVIVYPTQATWDSNQRYANVYAPILHPLYARFMQNLAADKRVLGGQRIAHTLQDAYHIGDGEMRLKYKLPDVVDATFIKGLKLKTSLINCFEQNQKASGKAITTTF